MNFESKHPIILSCRCWGVELYLNHEHQLYHHEGVEYLRRMIQKRFWIIGLRNAPRSVKNNWVTCRRHASAILPQMSDVPQNRVEARLQPFTNCGVDCFGPLEVKLFRRTVKECVCLFICLGVRAVHFELVDRLNTAACLDAVHRFLARRGQPKTMLSDKGTNFVAAANEFKAAFSELKENAITKQLAENGIKWSFNPPAAPHFGGVWKRLVRSCTKAMYNVLKGQLMKEDSLRTTLCIVEQLMRNLPTTAASGDIEDLGALTPNHFFAGILNVTWTNLLFTGKPASYRRLYRDQQKLLTDIWNRGTPEYLRSLQQRNKCSKEELIITNVGDTV